jgi:peroxiredoxin
VAVKERTHEDKATMDVEEMSVDDIDGTFVPSIRPEVGGIEIDGEAVLVIEGVWSVHWLNQISAIVLNEFDGVSSIDDVATRLSRAFGADPEVVRNDVLDLARQLGNDGFLVGVAAEAPKTMGGPVEGVPLGTAVPRFELPDLTGRTVSLEEFRGQEMLLVNWSPGCGFCARIAPEIAKLQPKLRARGVQTVFISIGTSEDLREQMEEFRLDIPVLLKDSEEAEIFYGMGTPAAYLVDSDGKTASKLAYGSEEVPVLMRAAAGLPTKGNGSQKATRSKTQARSKRAASPKRRTASKK